MVNLVNLLTNVFSSSNIKQTTAVKTVSSSSNPFANPFVTSQNANPFANYAKNQPVRGGYFAGYYNGKPNIVGQRLFLEV